MHSLTFILRNRIYYTSFRSSFRLFNVRVFYNLRRMFIFYFRSRMNKKEEKKELLCTSYLFSSFSTLSQDLSWTVEQAFQPEALHQRSTISNICTFGFALNLIDAFFLFKLKLNFELMAGVEVLFNFHEEIYWMSISPFIFLFLLFRSIFFSFKFTPHFALYLV